MDHTLRVGMIMAFLFMTIVGIVGSVIFFMGGTGPGMKYIKCTEKGGDKAMVISLDERQKELVVSGKKIAGTDIEIFNNVEVLAQWFNSNGHTKFWLDRITGELNITIQPSGAEQAQSIQTFGCESTTPKL